MKEIQKYGMIFYPYLKIKGNNKARTDYFNLTLFINQTVKTIMNYVRVLFGINTGVGKNYIV